MEEHLFVLCVTTILAGFVACGPLPSKTDDTELRKSQIYSELTKLRHILNKLEEEESLDKVSQNTKIKESNNSRNDDSLEADGAETSQKDKHGEPSIEANKDGPKDEKQGQDGETHSEVTDDQMDQAMRKFLGSLSDQSLRNLKEMRHLLEVSKSKDDIVHKDIPKKNHTTLNDDHSHETFLELPADNELDVSWKNIVSELETQRDQLYLQEHKPQKHEDDTKITTHTYEGVLGKFSDEIKTAVEKNLLSDVALAIHSGVSIDDIIEDILGKNKGEIM